MINCIDIVDRYKCAMKSAISGRHVGLAVIHAGNDYASSLYTKGKMKDCNDLGIDMTEINVGGDVGYRDVISVINILNCDSAIDGIIIQLPLSHGLRNNTNEILESISPYKDVDGARYNSKFMQCTPLGIMTLLDDIGCDVAGKKCCVIGRGKTVGKPIIDALISHDATVMCCHSKTPEGDKVEIISMSDIIITATGVPSSIMPGMVHDGQIIIDAGISKGYDGKMCGDCDKSLYDIIDKITPVPNGVGLLTRLALMMNTVDAAGILWKLK